LKALLAKRATNPDIADEAMRRYLSRNPSSPFRSREDIAKSPEMAKSIPPGKAKVWEGPRPVTDMAKWGEYLQAREQLLVNISKVMADHKLEAIVHKSVEHQPALIKDGINPPYVSAKGVPTLNTFLVYAASMTVPSGFTSDHLPVGMTFFGRPYSEPTLIKLAYGYEQTTHHRIPPKTTPPLGASVDRNVARALRDR
jgi:Asp-tRNA(Asn)/Glu-tRNA(Gln) amidotransferase A subunit family amidase